MRRLALETKAQRDQGEHSKIQPSGSLPYAVLELFIV